MCATEIEKPRRHLFRTVCLSAPVLALLYFAARIWIDSRHGWTVERLEASINAELPPHADKQAVAAWFDSHRISHRYFAVTEDAWKYSNDVPAKAGLRKSDLIGMDYTFMDGEQANVGFMESGYITIYFFLDNQGRLAGHFVDQFIYSL